MLKMAGSIMVIGATVLFGERKAAALKEQHRQMEYLRQLLYALLSEVRYARSPLGEIFLSVGESAEEPYKSWLLELGRRLYRRDGGSFSHLWKTSIREKLSTAALAEAEISRLSELGDRLGFADIEFQVSSIERYLTQLEVSADEIRKEMKIKTRLYHCLGIMSGMLIVTLLL